MPGLCGGIGAPTEVADALRTAFSRVWPDSEYAEEAGGFLMAHSFGDGTALRRSPEGVRFAVDGEGGLYRAGAVGTENEASRLFHLSDGEIRLTSACTGNVAVFDPDSRSWHLATDWSGSFPLFYAETAEGLLFSSLQKPLASAIGAAWDPVGIVEFLREGATVVGRSQHLGVHRLLPGQTLSYDPATRRVRLRETSGAWSGMDTGPLAERARVAEASWSALVSAARPDLPNGQDQAVMMSGGWDSRTLLAALTEATHPDRLLGYTHGDLESRELELVSALCRTAGVRLHREPITEAVYDPAVLRRGFERTENVIFPHWHRAGSVLAQQGVSGVSAGVYGEVLGGHYGPAMRLTGAAKMGAVATALLGRGGSAAPIGDELPRVLEFFSPRSLQRPWYLARDFWNSAPNFEQKIEADVHGALQRIVERGATTADQLVEAYITEHRGSQYINAQLLSCRAAVDVSLPFANRCVLERASRVPLEAKIHNALNRAMLRKHAPALLRFPCAATLVPARAPLVVQEGSRLARRLLETAQWKLHSASAGRLPMPRFGWVNLEFLRQSDALARVVDDLRTELWDRGALRARIGRLRGTPAGTSIHPLVFQLMTIYTTDLMLRPRST